jgi:aspartyl-tRNA(Asn)/glutamyl-tRNA(Gln) amidotransferase subunit B
MSETKYKATIGLEVHAEMATVTKMFCACKNDPDEERANVNVCPVCMGHPGTLPVLNKQAIKNVIKVGLALGSNIADFTEWDRKNYFYPDIPKGYQISQYKYPLVTGGKLNGINLTRIHLEEDTATSSHDKGEFSLVNFNRAGVPLMELVTEPELHSGKDTADFARELQLLLQYLGVGEANLEKGEMRIEANISVSDTEKFGTKVEVKNLNSFKAVEKAVNYEIDRQIEVIESGGKVVQETRGWDEDRQNTFSQRAKEDSHDYRYFPEPDIPKMKISEIPEFAADVLGKEIGELPWEKRTRYEKDYGIKEADVDIYIRPGIIANFFEKVCADFAGDKNLIKLASNYIISDLLGLIKATGSDSLGKLNDKSFAELIKMAAGSKISSRGAKDILKIMLEQGGEPAKIAEDNGLLQKSDEGELIKIAEKIISENAKTVADYKSGKEAALMALVGQGMKATKGSANPQVLKEVFLKSLSK